MVTQCMLDYEWPTDMNHGHNGTFDNRYYFECMHGFGVFILQSDVIRIVTPSVYTFFLIIFFVQF